MKSNYFLIFLLFAAFSITSCGEDEAGDVRVTDAKLSGSEWVDGAIEVDLDAVMEITFSKAVDPNLTNNNISIATTGQQINFNVTFSTDNTTLMLAPDGDLTNQSEYSLTISAGAIAEDGGMLVADYERSFSTK